MPRALGSVYSGEAMCPVTVTPSRRSSTGTRCGCTSGAQRGGDALARVSRARRAGEELLARVLHEEGHVRVRQREPDDRLLRVLQLGGLPAHELAPRRGVEEQILHGDDRAHPRRRVLHHRIGPTLHRHPGAHLGVGLGRVQGEARHRGDGRQRLAPEALGADGEQIVELAQLAGGVALQAQEGVLALMPCPSSEMVMRPSPPFSRATRTVRAPASIEFSTSSFTTEAGRSTTSPAAILLMRASLRRAIRAMGGHIMRRTRGVGQQS